MEAERDSKNWKKGTPVIQPIESINREVILRVLIEKLLPEIQLHYKNSKHKTIIQMDNSPSHFQGNEMDWENEVEKTGMDIVIKNQPSQSPDLNVLDLGYFNSIQSPQQRIRCETVDDLIEAVEKSFDDLDRKNLRNIFVMWQIVMLKIIEVEGDNT